MTTPELAPELKPFDPQRYAGVRRRGLTFDQALDLVLSRLLADSAAASSS